MPTTFFFLFAMKPQKDVIHGIAETGGATPWCLRFSQR